MNTLSILDIRAAMEALKVPTTPAYIIKTPLLNNSEYIIKCGNNIYIPTELKVGKVKVIELPEFKLDSFEPYFTYVDQELKNK